MRRVQYFLTFFDPINISLSFSILFYTLMIYGTTLSLSSLFITFIMVNALWIFFRGIFFWSRWIRMFLGFFIIIVYNLLSGYHIVGQIPVDYAVMADNASSALNYEALLVVYDRIGNYPLLIISVSLILFFIIPIFRKVLFTKISRPPIWQIIFSINIYILLFLFSSPQYDEARLFVKSVQDYAEVRGFVPVFLKQLPGTYPLIKKNSDLEKLVRPAGQLPDIIIIQIESFNADVIDKSTDDGTYFTPVFNKLRSKGLYVPDFYSNSVQSCKGQFATLFSMIPSYQKKIFSNYTNVEFQSLASILREYGYITMFFKAYKNINYDNTGDFLKKNGFDITSSIVPYLTEDDKKDTWGWGVEDKIFYKRFFEYLDKREDITSGSRPVFAVLHTVANHMNFNRLPKEKQIIYPDPKTYAENYINSIHLSDSDLRDFMKELRRRPYLENSIIIITGDHSYPIGRHGITHNEHSFYNDIFKTPFLLLWPDHLSPRVIDGPRSQLDIAPTILDLTGIQPAKHHFMGHSLVDPLLTDYPVYLVQPYDGTYLMIVDKNIKYGFHLKDNKEFAFDLARDPDEKVNIFATLSEERKDHLRRILQTIFHTQYLLNENKIWPPVQKN